MSYILGTHLNTTKQVKIALTQIFGIGHKKAMQICAQLGVSDTLLVNSLTRYQIDQIASNISQHYIIDSELRRMIENDIKRFISIGSYRGFRHNDGLPARGQRTHTNAKTCRKSKLAKNRPFTNKTK